MRTYQLASVVLDLLIALKSLLWRQAGRSETRYYTSWADADGNISQAAGWPEDSGVVANRIHDPVLELEIPKSDAVLETAGLEIKSHTMSGSIVAIGKRLVGGTEGLYITVPLVSKTVE